MRYFFLTDQVEKGNLTITYCPKDAMIRDFMRKPLQGSKFRQFSDDIMGIEPGEHVKPKKSDACGAREQLKRRYCLIIAANNRNINQDQASREEKNEHENVYWKKRSVQVAGRP